MKKFKILKKEFPKEALPGEIAKKNQEKMDLEQGIAAFQQQIADLEVVRT